MKTCSLFLTCSANICPLDPDRHLRNWFPGEDVCRHRDQKDVPFVRRQKKINRYRPEGIEDKPLDVQYLTDTAPVKRILTDEQRKAQVERLRAFRFTSRKVG